MDIEKARFNMIEQQVKPWQVADQRVLGAMATLPREQFVPEEHALLAYADTALTIGHHQQMLAPREIARMLQALKLDGTEKILEIGCGTGYSTALLGKLCEKVYAVDIITEFVKITSSSLQRLGFNNVVVEEVDASDGWMAHAPYDAILITSALPSLSPQLAKSLKPQGKIVCILDSDGQQWVTSGQLDPQGNWQLQQLFPIQAKQMINAEQPNQFVF
ncbi:protein-L-isoaspartate O-methyltransferase family protein [Aliikangiella sp. IMCC44653]